MLKVRFGVFEDSITDIDVYFNNMYEEDWFEDDFVKHMVKIIDNSDVLSNCCIQSPVLGQIPPEKLSGGVKALICLWKLDIEDFDDLMIDLIVCGDNCEDLILEIARRKDIIVSMSGFDIVFAKKKIRGICLNDNTDILSWQDWHKKAVKFIC